MSTQKEIPNALRLAAEFRPSMPADVMKLWAADVAQELRAQHELIQKLTDALVNANALSPCPMYSEAIAAAEAHK